VARKPEVLVRRSSRWTRDKGRELQRITRTAKNPVGLRQAIVVPLSGAGRPARNTTTLMQVSDAYLRDVIREFNQKGLDPQARTGDRSYCRCSKTPRERQVQGSRSMISRSRCRLRVRDAYRRPVGA
jgi:hypothetical protein